MFWFEIQCRYNVNFKYPYFPSFAIRNNHAVANYEKNPVKSYLYCKTYI